MKRITMLILTSLLSILLLSFHLTQDALRAEPGTRAASTGNLTVIVILLAYLCGTVLLANRRSGYVIMLIGGLFAAGMPVLHFTAPRFGLVARPGQGFFVWTMIALGVLGLFSVILSVGELWRYKRGE
ncbi:MAG: hypothetical protein JWP08_1463 [Bryobacterales bacterium]|nr:hypothetical protein [Bryobacterales bacterium]